MNDQAACSGDKDLLSNSKKGRHTREKPTTSLGRLSSALSQQMFYRNRPISPPTTTTTHDSAINNKKMKITKSSNLIQHDQLICSMCLVHVKSNLLDMRQNDQLKDNLVKYWSLKVLNKIFKNIMRQSETKRKKSAQAWLRAVCNQCIFKINARHQYNVLEAERLNRLTKSVNTAQTVNEQNMVSKLRTEIVINPPPTPDTTPTNSPGELSTELPHSLSPLMNNNNNNNNNNNINCHQHALLKDLENQVLSHMQDASLKSKQQQQQQQENSMLEAYDERSVPPLATESGGDKYKGNLECARCGKVYQRKHFYEKHVRSCKSRIQSLYEVRTIKRNQADTELIKEPILRKRAKSVFIPLNDTVSSMSSKNRNEMSKKSSPPKPSRTRKRTHSCATMPDDAISLKSFKNKTTPKNLPPLYQCNSCSMITDTINKMNKHKRVHLILYSCEKCSHQCANLNEFEFHCIICRADKGVTYEKGIETDTEVSSQRMTRSQTKALSTPHTRSLSMSCTRPSSPISVISKAATTKVMRQRTEKIHKMQKMFTNDTRTTRSMKQKCAGENNNTLSVDASPQSIKNNKRSNTAAPPSGELKKQKVIPSIVEDAADVVAIVKDNNNAIKSRDVDSFCDNSGNDAESDDDVNSLADTLYESRQTFVGQWVEQISLHDVTEDDENSLFNSIDEYEGHLQFHTEKEYDLYLLDRLRAEVRRGVITCYEPFCNYTTNSLLSIMLHDYQSHFKLLRFPCNKCGDYFTSKVFLDYHLDRQNKGFFWCYKCGKDFNYQNQLDRHFIQHNKYINYRCNYCKFEFLTKHELLEHSERLQHDPNGERLLLCRNLTPTISNPIQTERPQRHIKGRAVHILDDGDGKTHIPGIRQSYQPTWQRRPKIGKIDFTNQYNPNCWGCI